MKCPVGWVPAVLAILVHAQLLCLGSASKHRKKQPSADVVTKLRQLVQSRTDELDNQKNIAHGLQLEVRELQSELQTEKKALTTETEKEHVLQRKLNSVRAVLEDGPSRVAAKVDKAVTITMPAGMAAAVSTTDTDAAPKANVRTDAVSPAQPVDDSMEALSAMPDSEIETADEMVAQQTVPKPVAMVTHQAMQPVDEPLPATHSRQTTPQEPPPFFEAAALQSATSIKVHATKQETKAKAPVSKPVQAPPQRKAMKQSKPVRSAAFRGSSSPPAQAAMGPVAPASPPALVANSAAVTKDSSSTSSGADFDALEAQLHEEDRRIQDLDRENALDTMTDSASGSSTPATPVKAAPAQPKLELDAEGPMEDFLNVEAPGPETGVEAAAAVQPAPPVAAAVPDSPPADTLALPQMAEASGLDGALSDNQFLAQIAPRRS